MRRASGPSTPRWQAFWIRLLRWTRGQGTERTHSPRGQPPCALQLQSRQLWLKGQLERTAGMMPGEWCLQLCYTKLAASQLHRRMHCSVAEGH